MERAPHKHQQDATINPFTDPVGLLFLCAFVAVAIAVWRGGSSPVIGTLPLWAVVASTVAAGCVLLHWIQSGDPELVCRLAVMWSFLACGMTVATIANRYLPAAAQSTPLLDLLALQWGIVAATITLGGTAVLAHFRLRLEASHDLRCRDDARAIVEEVSMPGHIDHLSR
ncbi:hypothetical protein FX016_22980 [Cupriavidus gilardii]|nr:hypothetical protein FX016_22980 [Cupriavidus gilardii]